MNKKTQELAAAAMAQGVSPIEVLLGTMRSLWETATTKDKTVIAGLEQQGRTQRMVALEACDIAAKAAPYIHPKLVSQQVVLTEKPPRIDLSMLTDAELQTYIALQQKLEGAN